MSESPETALRFHLNFFLQHPDDGNRPEDLESMLERVNEFVEEQSMCERLERLMYDLELALDILWHLNDDGSYWFSKEHQAQRLRSATEAVAMTLCERRGEGFERVTELVEAAKTRASSAVCDED